MGSAQKEREIAEMCMTCGARKAVFKSHSQFTKQFSAFPTTTFLQLLLHSPQLTAAFLKVTAQPNTPVVNTSWPLESVGLNSISLNGKH